MKLDSSVYIKVGFRFMLVPLLLASNDATAKGIYHKEWIDFNKNGKMDVYENPSAPIMDRVKDLLNQMTLEEKTCQMATLYGSGRVLKDAWPTPQWKQEIWKDGIANIDEQANGLGTFGSQISYPYSTSVNNRQTIQRWFVENTRLDIPVDFTNEGIRGLNHDRATMFPAQCAQGASWDKNLIRQIAEVEGTWMKDICDFTGVKYEGYYAVGKYWVGGTHFVRNHPVFTGLPTNIGMNWPYQQVVRDGEHRYGFRLHGENLIVGSYKNSPFELGTAVGEIPYGKGKVLFSTLDIIDNLDNPSGPAQVARKLFANYINY